MQLGRSGPEQGGHELPSYDVQDLGFASGGAQVEQVLERVKLFRETAGIIVAVEGPEEESAEERLSSKEARAHLNQQRARYDLEEYLMSCNVGGFCSFAGQLINAAQEKGIEFRRDDKETLEGLMAVERDKGLFEHRIELQGNGSLDIGCLEASLSRLTMKFSPEELRQLAPDIFKSEPLTRSDIAKEIADGLTFYDEAVGLPPARLAAFLPSFFQQEAQLFCDPREGTITIENGVFNRDRFNAWRKERFSTLDADKVNQWISPKIRCTLDVKRSTGCLEIGRDCPELLEKHIEQLFLGLCEKLPSPIKEIDKREF